MQDADTARADGAVLLRLIRLDHGEENDADDRMIPRRTRTEASVRERSGSRDSYRKRMSAAAMPSVDGTLREASACEQAETFSPCPGRR